MKFPEKLKSRKLWVTVLTGVLVPIMQAVGVPEVVIAKVVLLVTVYIGGQSVADAAKDLNVPPKKSGGAL